MIKIATPISHFFKSSEYSKKLIEISDCLECRDSTIENDSPNQELFHCELQPIHELKHEDFSYLESIKTSKKEKTLFCEWQPTDEEREKLVTYCNSHGHELDDILEDMRLWDDANGNQAKYACHSSAVMRWCRTTRKGKKAAQRGSKRQQSVSKPKGRGELSDRQKQYAETVAEKMWNAYKAEGFYYKQILPDIIAFMQTDQTDADWAALGNGMDNPIERGWM